jgi:tetratricopeptide (TPR) repeat protein
MHSQGLIVLIFCGGLGVAVAEDAWDRQLAKGTELASVGRYAEARDALEMARSQAAENEPAGTRVALAINNLGTVYLRLNEIPQAEQCYRRSAEIWEAHGDVVNRLAPVTNLAAVYTARGQFTAADRLLHSQMQLAVQKLGPDHQHVSVILTYLANSKFLQTDYAAAEQLSERALEIVRRLHPSVQPDVALALNNLGTIYRAQHRLQESWRLYTEALEIMRNSGQPEHPAWIRTLSDYASVGFDHGRYNEAKSFLEQALGRAERTYGPNHPSLASILRDYAAVLRKTRHKSDAKKAEARASRIMEQSGRDNQLGYTVDLRTLSGFR